VDITVAEGEITVKRKCEQKFLGKHRRSMENTCNEGNTCVRVTRKKC
jgi:hypothetical protein